MKSDCLQILSSIGQPQDPQRQLEEGEGIKFSPYDASDNKYPDGVVFASTLDEITLEKDLESQKKYDEINERRKYLWVIIDDKILLAYEATTAPTPRGFLCHTNITGGEKAIIGGELWFLKNSDGTIEIYLNFDSGRYKTIDADKQHPIVFKLFECVGYNKVSPLLI